MVPSSRISSESARTDVKGKRSLCVTGEMTSSLIWSSRLRFWLASRGSAVASSSGCWLFLRHVGAGAQLRGRVADAQHVLQIQRPLLRHRRHHGPCRGTADGTGQLRLHELHQARVGRNLVHMAQTQALRAIVEQALRGLHTEEAPSQRQQRRPPGPCHARTPGASGRCA